MKRACFEALGIVILAAAFALGANFVRSDSLPLVREVPVYQETSGEGSVANMFLTVEAFLEAMKQPGIVILDARQKEDFDEGHIPGARSLPEAVCAEQFPQVLQDFSFEQEIVVYCSSMECGSAEEVAALLFDVGYVNTRVYSGGWEEWEELGLPIERGD